MSLPSPHLPLSPWLEQAWLQRYLDRELDVAEVDWFEAYLLDKPHLLDQVEADSALRAVVLAADAELVQRPPAGPAAVAEPRAAYAEHSPERSALRPQSQRRMPASLLALAASFVGGLGLATLLVSAPAAPESQEPAAEAPARLMFDLLRGGPVELREDLGDPRARLMVVDIALPLGSQIEAAHADLGERRVALPSARISGEGFATYTLPRSWRGRAQLHFDLRSEAGGDLPPVEIAL